jgi:hypothetical protein
MCTSNIKLVSTNCRLAAIIVSQKETIEALKGSLDSMEGTIAAKNKGMASLTTIAETKEEVIIILINKLEEAELEALKWHTMAHALVYRAVPLQPSPAA